MNALRRLKRCVTRMNRSRKNSIETNASTKTKKTESRKNHFNDEASLKTAKNFAENVKNKSKNKSNAKEKVC